jgi:hypothetical protein
VEVTVVGRGEAAEALTRSVIIHIISEYRFNTPPPPRGGGCTGALCLNSSTVAVPEIAPSGGGGV